MRSAVFINSKAVQPDQARFSTISFNYVDCSRELYTTVYCVFATRRATVVTVRTFWNRLRFSVRSVLRTRLTVQLYSVYSESSAQQSQYHTSSIKIFCQSDVTTHLALGSWQNSPLHTQPCYNVQIQIMGSRVSGRWRRSAFRLSEKAMPF